ACVELDFRNLAGLGVYLAALRADQLPVRREISAPAHRPIFSGLVVLLATMHGKSNLLLLHACVHFRPAGAERATPHSFGIARAFPWRAGQFATARSARSPAFGWERQDRPLAGEAGLCDRAADYYRARLAVGLSGGAAAI